MPNATRHVVELALDDLHALEARLESLPDLDDQPLSDLTMALVHAVNSIADALTKAIQ